MVGLLLLRRRRRPRPCVLHAHRAPAERGHHRGRARHLAARAGVSPELRAQRRGAGAGRRGRAAGVRLRAPAGAVGAALRRRGAPVRARRAHRDRPGGLPQGRGLRHPALHGLGRAAVVRVRPRRRASRADHYEQPGSIAGVARGGRAPPSARRPRDARPLVGRARLAAVPYWRWFGMVVDPDNFMVLNNVGPRTVARPRAAS